MGRKSLVRSLIVVLAVVAATVGATLDVVASGLTWAVVQSQVPSGGQGQLTGVSCAGTSFCVAVGSQNAPRSRWWRPGTAPPGT
jgi:hypothetical protein